MLHSVTGGAADEAGAASLPGERISFWLTLWVVELLPTDVRKEHRLIVTGSKLRYARVTSSG